MVESSKETQLNQIETTIEAYNNLNRYLRHNTIGILNAMSLALQVFKDTTDSSLLELLSNSMASVLELMARSYEINDILGLQEPFVSVKIQELLDMEIKQYSGKVAFTSLGDIDTNINSVFRTIFRSIMRNAITYRKADNIEIKVSKNLQGVEISTFDDGKKISDDMKRNIHTKIIFNNKIHTNSVIDLFIANEIAKAHGIEILIDNSASSGSKIIIKFSNNDLHHL